MFLLDTNTIIYFFKGKGGLPERLLANSPGDIAISVVSMYEIEVGIAKSSEPGKLRRQFDEFLAVAPVIPFDRPVARAAAVIRAELERRGRPIVPLDNLIAGTALAHHATLVTRNKREFGRVPNLNVANWYDE